MTTSVEILEFPSGTRSYPTKWDTSNITDDNLEKSAGKANPKGVSPGRSNSNLDSTMV